MRYEQAARSPGEYDKIEPAAKQFMEIAACDMKFYVLEGKSVPQPPLVSCCDRKK